MIDTAETNNPREATAADAALHTDNSRVPAISETGSPQAQPFVLRFLVMREGHPAAELAGPVRHTSETPADVCSAIETRSKDPGTGVPEERS